LTICALCAARDHVSASDTAKEAIASVVLSACATHGVALVLAALCPLHAAAHKFACDSFERFQASQRS
jgi:hypothetical protein